MLEKLKQLDIKEYIRRENLSVIVIGVIAAWVAWQTVGVVLENNQLQADIARRREEVALLELNNQSIEFGVEYFKTDEFLERSAKENLLLKRPEENVTIAPLTRNAPFPAQTESEQRSGEDQRSNSKKWADFLFGRQN